MDKNKFDFEKDLGLDIYLGDNADRSTARANVSPAVIKRLPRYFRYLRELIRQGKTRISSSELSEIMNVTASQIRQDIN